MRPSSVTSPSVSRPFAPYPALLGSGGPVHVRATGHAALPALLRYFGLVCHLAAASRTHFGFPYRTRYRRPHAAGPCEASPGQTLDRYGPVLSANTMCGGFVEYVPSPPSCRLGILRLADRFKLPPEGDLRYGPGPRLRLLRRHLTVAALPSTTDCWMVDTHCPLSSWVGAHPSWPTGFNPAFGYEYRSTTAQGDSHSYVKRPTGRTARTMVTV